MTIPLAARRLAVVATVLVIAVPAPAGAAVDPLRHMQYALDRLGAEDAWRVARGAGVIVAVVDTGVDLQHEDLRDKIVQGKDFVDDDDDPQDENGHGTHVAGLAAASADNSLGIAGVAPAALVMPLRVLDASGTGVESDVAAAIRFAFLQAQQRAMKLVINLSLTDLNVTGTASSSRLIEDAIREAWFTGAVVVAAAGNENLTENDYPAKGPNVLSVGATDANDRRASFSNQGALVVAPGEKVVSTFWEPRSPGDHAAYASGSGTSMAAPHVSGIAALLLSAGLNNEEVVNRIVTTAEDLGSPGVDDEYGYGRVNAARALGVEPAPGAVRGPGDLPLAAEGQFERIPSSPGPSPVVAAAPPPTGPPARTIPLAAAASLLLVAYATSRWQAGAQARARDERSPWEI